MSSPAQPGAADVARLLQTQFAVRNQLSAEYMPRHSERLAIVSREMAERFRQGGRLLAMGVGPYATDAQHVSVEFVHPVIVGKRALPALDLSSSTRKMLAALLRPDDIVMGFAPPDGDAQLGALLHAARTRGALAVQERIAAGGAIVAFGNGGSATDANDLVLDCVDPPGDLRPVPAVSLSMEPANLSAIANDVGVELMFLRQLIANGRPQDVAVAISTSGKSKNLAAALIEARKRGMLTLGFAGYDGGDFVREKLVDHAFVVRCDYIPRIQEVQASIYHVLRLALAGRFNMPNFGRVN